MCCLVTLLWARSMKAQVGYGIQCNQPSTWSKYETRAKQLLPFSADSRERLLDLDNKRTFGDV